MNHQELLNRLIGEWSGTGRGEYPTIESFEYIETLRFTSYNNPFILYEQKTQRRNEGSSELLTSHWENGFIHALKSGEIQINNAQSGGRTEVLTGSLEETENGLVLRMQSTSFLNDPRMLGTSRVFTIDGDTLHYTMHMRTNSVPEMKFHLEARLQRTS